MSARYLSRVMLRRTPAIDALAEQLLPEESGPRSHASHRLVWSLFAGNPSKKRDFLFRELAPGKGYTSGRAGFLVLSAGQPGLDHPLLEVETKPFAPHLIAGQLLGFSLRANPVRQTGANPKFGITKTTRHDVVMNALNALPQEQRAKARPEIIHREGRFWLEAQALRGGFALLPFDDDDVSALRIDGYDQLRFPRLGKRGSISVLEFDGLLRVTDPELFLSKLSAGFGRARAFGCGLMLIRRATS